MGDLVGQAGGRKGVTSVALTVPSVLTVTGSPITDTGTLAVSLATQNANLVFAGPSSGGAAAPTFRAIVAADLPAAALNVGTVTSVALTAPAEISVSGSPITSNGTLALSWASQVANKVLAAPSGGSGTPSFRVLVEADIPTLTTQFANAVILAPDSNTRNTISRNQASYAATTGYPILTVGDAASRGRIELGYYSRTTSDIDAAWIHGVSELGYMVFGVKGNAAASDSVQVMRLYHSGELYLGTNSVPNLGAKMIVDGDFAFGSTVSVAADTTRAKVYQATLTGGFAGDLVLQARSNGTKGVSIVTGSTPATRLYVIGGTAGAGAGWTGIGDDLFAPSARLHIRESDAGTNATVNVLVIEHESSGTPVASFGTGLAFTGKSSATSARNMGRIRAAWTTATDASRKARITLSAYDTAERDALMIEADGSNPMLGFFGTAPIAKPSVTGSRGGNAALADLLTKLASLGLITDSTSA